MVNIEKFSSFVFIENYFFEYLKKENIIINDKDLINHPFKHLIKIKSAITKQKSLLSSHLQCTKQLW